VTAPLRNSAEQRKKSHLDLSRSKKGGSGILKIGGKDRSGEVLDVENQ